MKVYELIQKLVANANMEDEIRFGLDKDTVRALNKVCEQEDVSPPDGILLDADEFTLSITDINTDTDKVILLAE